MLYHSPRASWQLFNVFLQLVDTKSVNNTTLLHFLEKTVSKHFPEMEVFLDELEKPAEAYRGAKIVCSINLTLNRLFL